MNRSMRAAALGAFLPTLLGAAETSAPTVLAHYVLLADAPLFGGTVPLARAIVAQPATACPAVVTSDGRRLPMTMRANPNPSAFGVVVCEAIVEVAGGGTATVEGASAPLPVPASADTGAGAAAPTSSPPRARNVVVVGDSGCKAPKQDCASAWPFAAIAAAAADDAPDLVIHVGDYNYSGTPNKTEAGEWSYDGCVPADGGPLITQSTYDTWPTWNHDFFTPAAPLLAAAPWVAVRGNHELCSRAGQGWFYFLAPFSPLLDPYRAQPGCTAPTGRHPPYRLRFAGLELAVLDTANACGGEDPESALGVAYEVEGYARQLAQLEVLLARDRPAWLLGHRPIWSVEQFGDDPPEIQNTTLQAALAALPVGLPDHVAMVLSGHMHQFFTLAFTTAARPPQLVIGMSGVALESSILASPYRFEVDGAEAVGLSINRPTSYGYLRATVTDAADWQGTIVAFDAAGEAQADPLATCGLPIEGGMLCRRP